MNGASPLRGAPAAEVAPEAVQAPETGPLRPVADRVRTLAREAGVSASVRRRLDEVADHLDALAYTADVAAEVEALRALTDTRLSDLADSVDADREQTQAMAQASGALGSLLGGAVTNLQAIRDDLDGVKRLGVRKFLRESRKRDDA